MPLLHSPLSLLSWRDTEPLRVPSSLRMTDGPELQMVLTTSAPAVFPALAESNRVCVYDRPGSMITTTDAGGTVALGEAARPGRSDPVPMPRDPAEVVTELHDLLSAADVPSPYVLVGHSLGGALNVLYARTYPDAVSGLVVVDSPLPPTGISSARSSGRAFKSWGWTRAWRPIFS